MRNSLNLMRVEGTDLAGTSSFDVDKSPTVSLPISSLHLADSPRINGMDDTHCKLLAESADRMPPIVVHGRSMRVIDGTYRVHVAVMRGETEICAKIFDGTDEDAFVLSVWMNIAHGLPLTLADRSAAASRIIESHPRWSNRMIASVTGLSPGTVAEVRRRSTEQIDQSNGRVGKDGRMRPVDASPGRLRASELLTNNPTASTRAIARQAGVSPSTVHDVRKRLKAGQGPLPDRQQTRPSVDDTRPAPLPRADQDVGRRGEDALTPLRGRDRAALLRNLKKDPSLRFSEAGRSLIRLLDAFPLDEDVRKHLFDNVPAHCAESVAALADTYSQVWQECACRLRRRNV